MQKAYKFAIFYFLFFTLLLLVSGVLLFENKIGFSATGVLNYYLGNEDKFTIAKSYIGVLKIILPHIFAFGLLSMVILHFLVFSSFRVKRRTLFLLYLMFLAAFLELGSPYFILAGYESFAYVKLYSFAIFYCSIIYVLWILFWSIVYE